MQQLAGKISQKLRSYPTHDTSSPIVSTLKHQVFVGTASLEFASQPLHSQIIEFARNSADKGCNRLQILPLFLLPGIHVMEDIPTEVSQAKAQLGEDIVVNLQPYLGSHPGLEALLANQLRINRADATILLAHGSRRQSATMLVEQISVKLGLVTAYWASPPSLESQVATLFSMGCRKINVIPYFLFAGGITDTIARTIEKLKLNFPTISFQLSKPLGANAEIIELIWDLMER
ncbi:MAG: sirohydrochlorin chelatase [Mastigocoleus sp. MO_188.B34]|nr:sirohydrochlorin chelatase [Mastigocoleus sp. MO_188.B34]MDJ0696678.1 sirohydrochlorin chelatase [Mastigocoleus sp. MO_188.B34]